MNKKILLTAAALTIIGGSVFTASKVSAETATASLNPMSTLVQKISDRFGLNKDEVQEVFDEVHAERYAEMEQRYEDRLTQLVADGTITDAQKQLILEKHNDLREEHEANKDSFIDKTPEERRAAFERTRSELEDWAEQNGIDIKYLMPFGGGRGHHMMMRLEN